MSAKGSAPTPTFPERHPTQKDCQISNRPGKFRMYFPKIPYFFMEFHNIFMEFPKIMEFLWNSKKYGIPKSEIQTAPPARWPRLRARPAFSDSTTRRERSSDLANLKINPFHKNFQKYGMEIFMEWISPKSRFLWNFEIFMEWKNLQKCRSQPRAVCLHQSSQKVTYSKKLPDRKSSGNFSNGFSKNSIFFIEFHKFLWNFRKLWNLWKLWNGLWVGLASGCGAASADTRRQPRVSATPARTQSREQNKISNFFSIKKYGIHIFYGMAILGIPYF